MEHEVTLSRGSRQGRAWWGSPPEAGEPLAQPALGCGYHGVAAAGADKEDKALPLFSSARQDEAGSWGAKIWSLLSHCLLLLPSLTTLTSARCPARGWARGLGAALGPGGHNLHLRLSPRPRNDRGVKACICLILEGGKLL